MIQRIRNTSLHGFNLVYVDVDKNKREKEEEKRKKIPLKNFKV